MSHKAVRILIVDEMLELRRRGITLREIGEMVGVSRQRIQQLLGKTRDLKPKKIKPTPKTAEERFWDRVDVSAPDDCWEWRGSRHPITGYGRLRFRGKQMYAHRVAYILTYGEIPNGAYILHSCDNPGCTNPKHTRAGTPADNVCDRDTRKRGNFVGGFSRRYVKRRKYIAKKYKSTGDLNQLAKEFNILPQSMYVVICRMRRDGEL